MTSFVEGNLELRFGPPWRVLKYDAPGSFFRTSVERAGLGSKAVDFVCMGRPDEPVVLVEVKDFSRAVPDREKFENVPNVVGIKVRDTVSGVVGAAHNATPLDGRPVFQEALRRLTKPPRVIYLFEDLATPVRRAPQKAANQRDVLLKKLRASLRWLTRDVAVASLANYRDYVPGLTISKT